MSEHAYWNLVRSIVEQGHADRRTKHDIREDVVSQVHAAHADGEPWAAEVLMRWENTGADNDYTRVFKDLNYTTFIRMDGRRVRKTVGYSRPKRSVESGTIIGRQVQAWWGMSRAAVVELRAELADQTERMADIVAALDRLIAAMDRHPGCSTAREAWEADGHSVTEIDLGEAI